MQDSKKCNDKVIDASAMLAIFMGQNSARNILTIFEEALENNDNVFLSVIHWGEILYVVERKLGILGRNEAEQTMSKMHLTIVDADQTLTREAARIKVAKKLPYADCFAAALCLLKNATLITGDNDFRKIQDKIKIIWV